MVDNTNPTDQFHTYTAPDAIPVAERPVSPIVDILSKLGVSKSRVESITRGVSSSMSGPTMTNARTYAQNNPGKVLGGLAALVIGAGLLRKRSR